MLDQLGHGKLNVVADTIRLESSPYQLPNDLVTAERLLLGFSSVTLDAAKMIAGRARAGCRSITNRTATTHRTAGAIAAATC